MRGRLLLPVCSWLLMTAAGVTMAATAATTTTAASRRPDFTGLWQIADTSLVVKPEDDSALLTDEALRRKREYREQFDAAVDDPSNFCVPHGMPWIMTSRARDYLLDIYQTKVRVTLLFEGMDVHRLIYLGQTRVPDTYAPGTNGYSLGHWEGDTLVIRTSALRPSNPVGPYQRSEQMQVNERWRLIRHPKFGKALEVNIVATDPAIYRKPGHGYGLFVPAPAGSTLNAYGCNESLFDDHIEQVRKQHEKRN